MDTNALCRAELEWWRARGIMCRRSSPPLQLGQTLLKAAIGEGATRMVWQCQDASFVVRWKRDGRWQTARVLPLEVGRALIATIKLWFDARWKNHHFCLTDTRNYLGLNCALTTVPTHWGETADFGFAPIRRRPVSLAYLGILPAQKRQLERWLRRPSGVIAFSTYLGSVGGWNLDTRLLETLLQFHSSPDEAVACLLPDWVRVPVPLPDWVVKIRLDWNWLRSAEALRSLLRSDIDMVATPYFHELSSLELLFQLALQGKRVLAQQHNGFYQAAGIPNYLSYTGLERFIVGAALLGALSCKWLRRLCPHCAARWTPPRWQIEFVRNELRSYGTRLSPRPQWKRPVGCARCQNVGFRGEIGAFELVDVADDPKMQRAITEGADTLKVAREGDYQPALVAALRHAMRGRTSIDEALRVCLKPAHANG